MPRVHAAYDLTNDGKTVIKGGWGRFAAMRGVDEANYVNPMVMSSTTFRWRDLNGNRDYDAGEVNLDPNGPDFVSQTGFTSGSILNPDEKAPITDEFSASIERQLFPDFAVRRHRHLLAATPTSRRVINPLIPYERLHHSDHQPRSRDRTAVVGNADDPGSSITYWEYPASLRGACVPGGHACERSARSIATYTSVEIAVSKRLSNRWQAMAAYSRTKLHVPATYAPIRTSRSSRDNNTIEWTAKASGAYQLPFDVLGIGELRAAQWRAVAADASVPRRPADSDDRAAGRTARRAALRQSAPARRARPQRLPVREPQGWRSAPTCSICST